MKIADSGKELRRKKVADDHEILLLVGDNLGDFSKVFDKKKLSERNQLVQDSAAIFGKRFIVLPNAMYGAWEAAFYPFQNNLSPSEKVVIIMRSIKNISRAGSILNDRFVSFITKVHISGIVLGPINLSPKGTVFQILNKLRNIEIPPVMGQRRKNESLIL